MNGYVTVMPAAPRSGWIVCSRQGSMIRHDRLENAPIFDREAAREAAQRLFPDLAVYVQGDTHKPWL